MNRFVFFAIILPSVLLLNCRPKDQSAHPATAPATASKPASAPSAAQLKFATGKELVKFLQEDYARLAAFRELIRRNNTKTYGQVNSAETVVCPQGEGKSPIYVVLRNSSHTTSSDQRLSGFLVEKPEEIFGDLTLPEEPVHTSGKLQRLNGVVLDAFDSEGKTATPFGGDNLLSYGTVADINQDGVVERVDHGNCGSEKGGKGQVLIVSAVREKAKTLLAVLYNWGPKADWDYEFADRNNDGVIEIEFGPASGNGIVKPEVVFRWDKDQRRFLGPQPKPGDHFYVLDFDPREYGGAYEKNFEQLAARLKAFPADVRATGQSQDGFPMESNSEIAEVAHEKAPPPPPKPYRYHSLQDLSNEQLFVYMGEGRKQYQFEDDQILRTHAPKDFWTKPPRQLALALVDENRIAEHRKAYLLAIDDRDGKKPPESCTAFFSYQSRRCYFTSDSLFFIRVDPKGSYLAFTNQSGRGAVYASIVDTQPVYDLRRVDLSYDEAKQFVHVIWWLSRVRSWTALERFGSLMSSTADGSGDFKLTAPGETFVAEGTLWADAVSERWRDHYGEETFLNLVDFLFQSELTRHLGKRWTDQEPGSAVRELVQRAIQGQVVPEPNADEAAKKQLEATKQSVRRMMELASDDETRLALPIAAEAVQAAGDLAIVDLGPRLAEIQKRLKLVASTQSVEDIEKQIDQQEERTGASGKTALADLRAKLERARLRRAVGMSLKQIDAAGDPTKLQAWAESWDYGWQWAAAHLRPLDKKKYVAALERHLKNTEGKWSRQIFDAIEQTDPERAKVLSGNVSATSKSDLAVSAYSVLERANLIKDSDKRIDALIAVVLDPKSGWEQRGKAIDLLVPEKTPLKFPERKIDEALVKLLDPAMADESINFTLGNACNALALRGRIETFDKMVSLLPSQPDSDIHSEILGSLVRLGQIGKPEHRAKLLEVIAPHLKNTNRHLSQIISFVYAADLRELRDSLQAIATSGPEDYEGQKAYSSTSGSPSPVSGRYHMARKVLALWDEQETVTKAKLLIAFGILNTDDEAQAALQTTEKNLAAVSKTLSDQDRKKVLLFIDWYKKGDLPIPRSESLEADTFSGRARKMLEQR